MARERAQFGHLAVDVRNAAGIFAPAAADDADEAVGILVASGAQHRAQRSHRSALTNAAMRRQPSSSVASSVA